MVGFGFGFLPDLLVPSSPSCKMVKHGMWKEEKYLSKQYKKLLIMHPRRVEIEVTGYLSL